MRKLELSVDEFTRLAQVLYVFTCCIISLVISHCFYLYRVILGPEYIANVLQIILLKLEETIECLLIKVQQ